MIKVRVLSALSFMTLAAMLAGPAFATPFTPVIDEFWIVKNGGSGQGQFRDSFDDGAPPPSGPQDGVSGTPDTYNVYGPSGMVSETGGKLTMNPSLGETSVITASYSEKTTSALKFRTILTDPLPNSLLEADSFELHGLYDLSSLPAIVGQSFGIRLIDRVLGPDPDNPTNEGNDTIHLLVGRNINTGALGVALHEDDFANDTIDRVDFFALDLITAYATATQIELIITKAADTAFIGAQFNLWGNGGVGGDLLLNHVMSPFSSEKNANLAIYEGELYTRAQFLSTDRLTIPEPSVIALLGVGLAGVSFARKRLKT